MGCMVRRCGMMRYYKIESNGYISLIGIGTAGIEITEQEYAHIRDEIKSAPTAPDGYAYRLTESLEWEQVKVETPDIVDTMTETEQKAAAYDILTGVSE